MRCHYLQGKYMIYCTAVKEGRIATPSELDAYCRRDTHVSCPLYLKAEEKNEEDETFIPYSQYKPVSELVLNAVMPSDHGYQYANSRRRGETKKQSG